jgi:hypothetical protein
MPMIAQEEIVDPLLSDWDEPLPAGDVLSTKDGVRVACALLFVLLLVTSIWASNVGKIDAQASKAAQGPRALILCPRNSKSETVCSGLKIPSYR